MVAYGLKFKFFWEEEAGNNGVQSREQIGGWPLNEKEKKKVTVAFEVEKNITSGWSLDDIKKAIEEENSFLESSSPSRKRMSLTAFLFFFFLAWEHIHGDSL